LLLGIKDSHDNNQFVLSWDSSNTLFSFHKKLDQQFILLNFSIKTHR